MLDFHHFMNTYIRNYNWCMCFCRWQPTKNIVKGAIDSRDRSPKALVHSNVYILNFTFFQPPACACQWMTLPVSWCALFLSYFLDVKCSLGSAREKCIIEKLRYFFLLLKYLVPFHFDIKGHASNKIDWLCCTPHLKV